MLSNNMFVLKYSALFVLLFNTSTAQSPQQESEENETLTPTEAILKLATDGMSFNPTYVPTAAERVDYDFDQPVTGRSVPKELQDMFKTADNDGDNAAYCMRQYSECINIHTLKPICATNEQLSKRMFRSICEMMHENCRYNAELWHYMMDDECEKITSEIPTEESTNTPTEQSTETPTDTTIAIPTETTTAIAADTTTVMSTDTTTVIPTDITAALPSETTTAAPTDTTTVIPTTTTTAQMH